jgi:hypothetical protein
MVQFASDRGLSSSTYIHIFKISNKQDRNDIPINLVVRTTEDIMEGTILCFVFDHLDLGPLETSLSLITAFVIDVQPQ